MEQKTECPLCQDLHNNCFVEKTEIEGKPFESYMCFGCGMTTNSFMTIDSDRLEELTKNNTQLMNDLKIMDEERGLIWYPSVVNMGEKGLIYPDGVKTDWYWHYAKVIEVPEEERKHYEGHDKRLDIENPQVFGQFEFMDACKAMGIVKDLDG
tara:strand:- start:2475 stop:2933 length:459 start_codon:yes stop_codon:yes gene_type:complete